MYIDYLYPQDSIINYVWYFYQAFLNIIEFVVYAVGWLVDWLD